MIESKSDLKNKKGNVAHTAFLLGNAYYNMSERGNSPYYVEYDMYRRISKQGRKRDSFYDLSKAIKYYKIAEKHAKNDAFDAFCYRVIIKCDNQSYNNESYYFNKSVELDQWKKFHKKYPKHAEKLKGCVHFEYYSTSWKL